jgi:hypothetical protein
MVPINPIKYAPQLETGETTQTGAEVESIK